MWPRPHWSLGTLGLDGTDTDEALFTVFTVNYSWNLFCKEEWSFRNIFLLHDQLKTAHVAVLKKKYLLYCDQLDFLFTFSATNKETQSLIDWQMLAVLECWL